MSNFYILARRADGKLFWTASAYPEEITKHINALTSDGFTNDDITIITADATAVMTPEEFNDLWS